MKRFSYTGLGITYKGMEMSDARTFEENPRQEDEVLEAVNYVDSVIQSNESNKIMVNCFGGISRSSTVILSYMILKKNFGAHEAIRTVRSKQEIIPSKLYLSILAKLHNTVHGFDNVQMIGDDIVETGLVRNVLNKTGKA